MPSASHSAVRETVDGVPVVRLRSPQGASVSIAPRIGNLAYEFLVGGKNAFWFPFSSLGEFAASPALCGNPFLAPWANRLDEHGFQFEGARYALNRGLGNYLLDQFDQPIHGLLVYASQWRVVSMDAGESGASVTSRLEFSRHPSLMAQFPFAHEIEMTYRLTDRALQVTTVVRNLSAEAMPVSVGFHPYFQVHDCPRDEWRLHLATDSVWDLNERFTPTGGKTPIGSALPDAGSLPLRGRALDHVFGDLHRGGSRWPSFHVTGARERVRVDYGPGFEVAVVYAPRGEGQSFVCFEPMSGVTNAFNLASRGVYDALPVILPGKAWSARFRIVVEGF